MMIGTVFVPTVLLALTSQQALALCLWWALVYTPECGVQSFGGGGLGSRSRVELVMSFSTRQMVKAELLFTSTYSTNTV